MFYSCWIGRIETHGTCLHVVIIIIINNDKVPGTASSMSNIFKIHVRVQKR